MEFKVKVGDFLPAFHALNQDGMEINNDILAGMSSVIFFYSKENALRTQFIVEDFRDHFEEFDALNIIIAGVSPYSVEINKKYYEEHRLNYLLLSDDHFKMYRAFDLIKTVHEKHKIIRSTFIVDRNGVIRWVEHPVHVEGHVARVLKAIKGMG